MAVGLVVEPHPDHDSLVAAVQGDAKVVGAVGRWRRSALVAVDHQPVAEPRQRPDHLVAEDRAEVAVGPRELHRLNRLDDDGDGGEQILRRRGGCRGWLNLALLDGDVERLGLLRGLDVEVVLEHLPEPLVATHRLGRVAEGHVRLHRRPAGALVGGIDMRQGLGEPEALGVAGRGRQRPFEAGDELGDQPLALDRDPEVELGVDVLEVAEEARQIRPSCSEQFRGKPALGLEMGLHDVEHDRAGQSNGAAVGFHQVAGLAEIEDQPAERLAQRGAGVLGGGVAPEPGSEALAALDLVGLQRDVDQHRHRLAARDRRFVRADHQPRGRSRGDPDRRVLHAAITSAARRLPARPPRSAPARAGAAAQARMPW